MKTTKRIYSLLFIAVMIGGIAFLKGNRLFTNYAQKNATVTLVQPKLPEAIKQSFQKGEATLLYPFFDELMSICINEKEDIYLAYNGKVALQNFFHAYPPATFELKHKGKSRGGKENYFIGDYTTTSKEQLRIYIFTENGLIGEIEISNQSAASL